MERYRSRPEVHTGQTGGELTQPRKARKVHSASAEVRRHGASGMAPSTSKGLPMARAQDRDRTRSYKILTEQLLPAAGHHLRSEHLRSRPASSTTMLDSSRRCAPSAETAARPDLRRRSNVSFCPRQQPGARGDPICACIMPPGGWTWASSTPACCRYTKTSGRSRERVEDDPQSPCGCDRTITETCRKRR